MRRYTSNCTFSHRVCACPYPSDPLYPRALGQRAVVPSVMLFFSRTSRGKSINLATCVACLYCSTVCVILVPRMRTCCRLGSCPWGAYGRYSESVCRALYCRSLAEHRRWFSVVYWPNNFEGVSLTLRSFICISMKVGTCLAYVVPQ